MCNDGRSALKSKETMLKNDVIVRIFIFIETKFVSLLRIIIGSTTYFITSHTLHHNKEYNVFSQFITGLKPDGPKLI